MTLAERLRSKNQTLRVEELADLLGVAIRTVYKEVEGDRIPFSCSELIRFSEGPHRVAGLAGRENDSPSSRRP